MKRIAAGAAVMVAVTGTAVYAEGIFAQAAPAETQFIKTDTVIGRGLEAGVGNIVTVHYTGWHYKPLARSSRGREFQNSLVRNEPLVFELGQGRVIRGFDEGILGMRVGGKRTVIVPASLAYGARGSPPSIPPGADLIFDIELLDVR